MGTHQLVTLPISGVHTPDGSIWPLTMGTHPQYGLLAPWGPVMYRPAASEVHPEDCEAMDAVGIAFSVAHPILEALRGLVQWDARVVKVAVDKLLCATDPEKVIIEVRKMVQIQMKRCAEAVVAAGGSL